MRRMMIGAAALAALVAGIVSVGAPSVRASEPFEKATGLKCEQCHKHSKEEFEKDKEKLTGYEGTQDLVKECGKKSVEFLKKHADFKPLEKGGKRTKAETTKFAKWFVAEKWKCTPSADGK